MSIRFCVLGMVIAATCPSTRQKPGLFKWISGNRHDMRAMVLDVNVNVMRI